MLSIDYKLLKNKCMQCFDVSVDDTFSNNKFSDKQCNFLTAGKSKRRKKNGF